MHLPKTKVSKAWIVSNFGKRNPVLSFIQPDKNDEYEVVVCSPGEIEELQAELLRYRTKYKEPSNAVVKYGVKLANLLHLLPYKLSKSEFHELCVGLSELNLADLRALYRGWNIRKTPKQLYDLLVSRREKLGAAATPEYIHALALLELARVRGTRLLR